MAAVERTVLYCVWGVACLVLFTLAKDELPKVLASLFRSENGGPVGNGQATVYGTNLRGGGRAGKAGAIWHTNLKYATVKRRCSTSTPERSLG